MSFQGGLYPINVKCLMIGPQDPSILVCLLKRWSRLLGEFHISESNGCTCNAFKKIMLDIQKFLLSNMIAEF